MMSWTRKHITIILVGVLACQFMMSFRVASINAEEPILFKPLAFYVAELRDLRINKGTDLAILKKFIADDLPKDQALNPIIIDIRELSITETPGKTGMVDGLIKIDLSFILQKEELSQHLLNYTGGMKYSRLSSNKNVLEQHLKQLNKAALLYFNKWINSNINTTKVFASGVKIRIEQFENDIEGDTIYYAASRPLTWADFQSKYKRSNKYAAIVMPNIAYDQDEKIEDGIIQVTLTLKTFLAKSDCWLGVSYKDDYMLNHEQRHFDIAKIVMEQFRQHIQKAKVSPYTYEAVINMQYLESYRDMNKMQKAYDTETSHGLNRTAQQYWDKRIDDLLSRKKVPDA